MNTCYTFGPYELDPQLRRLRRDGELVGVPDRHVDILVRLVADAGAVLTKDALIEAGWRDVAVTDNSLEQAISTLRRTLGGHYIDTVPRRGYRFTAAVTRHVARATDESLDALLQPHRVWLDGRAALETLGQAQASQARAAFAEVLAASADYAPAHVGLANACAFAFEASRADPAPDRGALAEALAHAREACRLAPAAAESWATLAFVLHLMRESQQAIAAARRAISLEPDNWRHHLRLAVAGWGEERLQAAQRTLALLPGLALAHWLAATVHVARQSLDAAARELERGARSQDAQAGAGRFSAVALHWLLGLVALARGDEDFAREQLARELAFEADGHLYARECCANTWYALGAIELRHGRQGEAAEAFHRTLQRVPGHPMALAGLAAAGTGSGEAAAARAGELDAMGLRVEAAMARAILPALAGRAAEAATLIDTPLQQAPAGSAGWTLPIDPLLQVRNESPEWRGVLARLRARAA